MIAAAVEVDVAVGRGDAYLVADRGVPGSKQHAVAHAAILQAAELAVVALPQLVGVAVAVTSLAEAAAAATSVLDRTQVFVLLNTLDYLEKGGRIGKASALLGSVFQIKPILTVENGEVATKSKARTFKKGLLSLQQFTEECGELERAGILYSTDDTEAKTFAGLLNNSFVKNANPSIIRLSPVIGAHGGPGVVGAVCVTSKK